jgi:hypothetical protein
MGGTIADLTMTVGKSIAAFNRHDKGAVEENLAPDITVVSLHPKETFFGQDGVKNIIGQFGDNPTFTLLHLDIDLHGATDGAATKATITGTAKWNDKFGPETLQFTFECIFTNRWLFKKVSAVTV